MAGGARQAFGHRDAAAEVTFSPWRLSRCALWHEVGGGGGGGEWQEAGYDDMTVCTSWMTDEFTSYEVPYCATLSYFRQQVQCVSLELPLPGFPNQISGARRAESSAHSAFVSQWNVSSSRGIGHLLPPGRRVETIRARVLDLWSSKVSFIRPTVVCVPPPPTYHQFLPFRVFDPELLGPWPISNGNG